MIPRALTVSLAAALLSAHAHAQSQQSIAITRVTIIPPSGAPQRDMTVVITGNRIATVGKAASVRVPASARVVSGRGKYLIPGLWDMHAHLAGSGRSSLALLAVNGVTGARDMGGEFELVRGWRDSISAGTLFGPRIEMVGPIIERSRWLNAVRGMLAQQGDTATVRDLSERIGVETEQEAVAAVQRIAALGVSMVKLRNSPQPPAYFALLREARARGVRVVGHPPTQVSLAQASDSGQASIEHELLDFRAGTWSAALDILTPTERADLFSRLARNRTALVPTSIAGLGFRRMPDSAVLAIIDDRTGMRDHRRRYVDSTLALRWRDHMMMKRIEGAQPDWVALHRQSIKHLRALDSAGVPLLVGSDLGGPLVYPGFAVHDELELLVNEAGLSPQRALWGATLGAAQFFGKERELGSVEAGKLADLILLEANPLVNIRSTQLISAVVVNGRLLDERARLELLERIAEAARKG